MITILADTMMIATLREAGAPHGGTRAPRPTPLDAKPLAPVRGTDTARRRVT